MWSEITPAPVGKKAGIQHTSTAPSCAALYYAAFCCAVLQVIEDDITVEQFSGAMTNMVYRCGLMQGGAEVQVGQASRKH